MNQFLTDPITELEITEAAYQMGRIKAPGLDGFPGVFYQHNWDLIKEDVFFMVTNFFNTGQLNPNLNQTLIALIPKIQNPKKISDYRPISCCNFSYKIIAKTLANHLTSHYSLVNDICPRPEYLRQYYCNI